MRSKDCTDDINEISLGVYRNVQGLLSRLHQSATGINATDHTGRNGLLVVLLCFMLVEQNFTSRIFTP